MISYKLLQEDFGRWRNIISLDALLVIKIVEVKLLILLQVNSGRWRNSNFSWCNVCWSIVMFLNFWWSDTVSCFVCVNMHQLQRLGYIYPAPLVFSWWFLMEFFLMILLRAVGQRPRQELWLRGHRRMTSQVPARPYILLIWHHLELP